MVAVKDKGVAGGTGGAVRVRGAGGGVGSSLGSREGKVSRWKRRSRGSKRSRDSSRRKRRSRRIRIRSNISLDLICSVRGCISAMPLILLFSSSAPWSLTLYSAVYCIVYRLVHSV